MRKIRTPLLQRFEKKYIPEPNSGCWIWTGATQTTIGYGTINVNGDIQLAHRVSYILFRKPISPRMEAHHTCQNRLCVNPDHLEILTRREHLKFGTARSAHAVRTNHCKNGHEFTFENTYINPRGHRQCRKCRCGASWKQRQKKKKVKPHLPAYLS